MNYDLNIDFILTIQFNFKFGFLLLLLLLKFIISQLKRHEF